MTPLNWLAIVGMAVIIATGTGLVWLAIALFDTPWAELGSVTAVAATVGAAQGWRGAAERDGDWP